MRTTRPSRRLTRAMVVLAVAVTVASAAGACSPSIVDDAGDSANSGQVVDMPLERAAEHLAVTVPPEATDPRWRYERQRMDDTVVLSFVLPTVRVEPFLAAAHAPPLEPGVHDDGLSFADLDLPSPAGLPGARTTSRETADGLPVLTVNVVPQDSVHSRIYLSGW